MKRVITLCILAAGLTSRAAVHTINVMDFSFNPISVSATVGDVIRWVWISGLHTTTSVTIPGGATPWDQIIDNGTFGVMQYDLTVTVEGTYNYQCTPHAPFMVGSFTVAAALPVKLTEFSLTALDKKSVMINWKTISEENSDYFSVERSEDGRKFDEIARVNAAGSSNSYLSYAYTDNGINPMSRYLYYRLNMVDIGGRSGYSQIVMLKRDVSNDKIIVRISPNPVSQGDHIEMWFNADAPGKLSAVLYDAGGKLVFKSEMNAFRGVNFGHLHIHDVLKGIYFLKLSIGQNTESTRIVVME